MKSTQNILLVLSSIALCICAEAISSIELNRDNFESEIKGKNNLVIFYSPRYVLERVKIKNFGQINLTSLSSLLRLKVLSNLIHKWIYLCT